MILRFFRIPYPLSKRCEVPMEDPTNRGFCRPLPVDLFPIPVLPEMPRESESTFALRAADVLHRELFCFQFLGRWRGPR